jgi:DNA polymerase III psi subunit
MMIVSHTKAKCVECDRVFDLRDEDEANEWFYGHDCEQHEWKCTQVAGQFKCVKCNKKAFWNRFTQQKEIK